MSFIENSTESSGDGLWNLVKHLEFLQYEHSIEQIKPSHFDFPAGTEYTDVCCFSDSGIDVIKDYLHVGLINKNSAIKPTKGNRIVLVVWPLFVSPAAYSDRKLSLPGIKKIKTIVFHVPEAVFVNYSSGSGSIKTIVAATAILTPFEDWKLLERMVLSSFYHLTFDKPTTDIHGDIDVWRNQSADSIEPGWRQLLFVCCGPQGLAYLVKRMLKRNWAKIVRESVDVDVRKHCAQATLCVGCDCISPLVQWAKFSFKQDALMNFLNRINSVKPVLFASEISEKLKIALNEHKSSSKKHLCTLCPFETDLIANMELHHFIHSGERPFVCGTCGTTFNRPGNLLNHENAVHKREFRYECGYCGRGYLRPSLFKYHLSVHTRNRDFQIRCCKCSMVFKEESLLKKHILSHATDPTFDCDICLKRLNTKSALLLHARVHSKDKPFGCHICDRAFWTKAHLVRHYLTHSDSRSHACRFCDKEFKNIDTLRIHEVGQHGEEAA